MKTQLPIPEPNETAIEFIERMDHAEVSEHHTTDVLKSHFRLGDSDLKEIKLQSRPWWESFYRARVKEIFEKGGSRYGALRFIERKNQHHLGKRTYFTPEEIDQIINTFGKWEK